MTFVTQFDIMRLENIERHIGKFFCTSYNLRVIYRFLGDEFEHFENLDSFWKVCSEV